MRIMVTVNLLRPIHPEVVMAVVKISEIFFASGWKCAGVEHPLDGDYVEFWKEVA